MIVRLVGLENGCKLCGSPLDDLFHCYLDLYLYFTTPRNIEQQYANCHYDDSWLKMDANCVEWRLHPIYFSDVAMSKSHQQKLRMHPTQTSTCSPKLATWCKIPSEQSKAIPLSLLQKIDMQIQCNVFLLYVLLSCQPGFSFVTKQPGAGGRK